MPSHPSARRGSFSGTDYAQEGPDVIPFGIEKELQYSGHISQAKCFIPLPKRVFASADETHIRVWGLGGDLAKTTFPSNRRSMVAAMAHCPTYNAIFTAEVDMTIKLYNIESLELIDSISLEQARENAQRHAEGKEKARSSQKVLDLSYIPSKTWLLLGGDGGCEVWRILKSSRRRAKSIGRLEHHLTLEPLRQLIQGAVLRVLTDSLEQRVLIWGPDWVSLHDMELNMITHHEHPHSGAVRCACVQVVTNLDTVLLTGGEDGVVNLWSIQGHSLSQIATSSSGEAAENQVSEDGRAPVSMRLQHSFRGHNRAVEFVCFYHRLAPDMRQQLCISCARDSKFKVWSLASFSIMYTLDISLLDNRAGVFPITAHCLAISSAPTSGTSEDEKTQRTTVTLCRFTSNVALPFATSHESTVVHIGRCPFTQCGGSKSNVAMPMKDAIVIVSEDMAVRVVGTDASNVFATLPPPPNSQVQVLRAFLCPMWQLLILWLTSQEVAIFFIPMGAKLKVSTTGSDPLNGPERATGSSTPLLLRRFGIAEVGTKTLDKDLSKEAFESVSLHYGIPPPCNDSLLFQSVEDDNESGADGDIASEACSQQLDWFLIIGTKLGTLQAFRISSILHAMPIWERLAMFLPSGAWCPQSQKQQTSCVKKTAATLEAQERLLLIEAEHRAAIEEARIPGQRPFPKGASALRLHGRWKCHDYEVKVTEAVSDRIMTVDAKRILRVWRAVDMTCLFNYCIGDFSCYTLCVESTAPESPKTPSAPTSWTGDEYDAEISAMESLKLTGLALGVSSGQLVHMNIDVGEPKILTSSASHMGAPLRMDCTWPSKVIVSIGTDEVVKIWSESLSLLREITFPQPLTSVAFRNRDDIDTAAGHGDLFLGFAAHVERIKFSVWSKGLLQNMAARGSSMNANGAMLSQTHRGAPRLDASDNIEDHVAWLGAERPDSAKRCLEMKRGVGLAGVGMVHSFTRRLHKNLEARRDAASKRAVSEAARAKFRAGIVSDFRGPPQVEVNQLGGQPVDIAKLGTSNSSCQLPGMQHERCDTLDMDDFRTVTRHHPGYCDWSVRPSALVDAPREYAIRGAARKDVALVTSLGVGHLFGKDTHEDSTERLGRQESTQSIRPSPPSETSRMDDGKAPSPPQVVLPQTGNTKMKTQGHQRKHSRVSSKPRKEHEQQNSPLLSQEQSRANSSSGREHTDSLQNRDPWRQRRIGRGVPALEYEQKPQAQHMANTERDTMQQMRDRGEIVEVPDAPEDSFLKEMCKTKDTWLYSPHDSSLLSQTKQIIREKTQTKEVPSWTPNGRLVSAKYAPPTYAVPPPNDKQPPHLSLRAPMTRAEFTERRLIAAAEAASRGYLPQAPNLTPKGQQLALPPRAGSARASSRGPASARATVVDLKRRPSHEAGTPKSARAHM